MKAIFFATLLCAVLFIAALVAAGDAPAKAPTAPPRVMGPMSGMMGDPAQHLEQMAAMMKMMQATPEMMEHCRRMMSGMGAAEPDGER